MVNLPAVHLFASPEEIPELAAAINTIIHGKVKIKCEDLGILGGQHVGLFYIQRNMESQQLHDEFIQMINNEEEQELTARDIALEDPPYPEDEPNQDPWQHD